MDDPKKDTPQGEPEGHKPRQFPAYTPGGSPRPAEQTKEQSDKDKLGKQEPTHRTEHVDEEKNDPNKADAKPSDR